LGLAGVVALYRPRYVPVGERAYLCVVAGVAHLECPEDVE
jgi:hypothetical protein